MSIIEQLKAPFPEDKIHWRVGATTKDKTKGIGLAYIDARDLMDRLDEVVGAENWQAEYPFPGCCRIGIFMPTGVTVQSQLDGSLREAPAYCWVWKSNGAGETDVEGEKGQYSDAFKRAGVLWGVARYLYDLPNTWVAIEPSGRSYKLSKRPTLPAWALPQGKSKTVEPKEKVIVNRAPPTGKGFISGVQVTALNVLMKATSTDAAPFCSYLGVPNLAQMPEEMFDTAVKALEDKKRKMPQ